MVKKKKFKTIFKCMRNVHHSVLPWILMQGLGSNNHYPAAPLTRVLWKGLMSHKVCFALFMDHGSKTPGGKNGLCCFCRCELGPQGYIFTAAHVDLAAWVPLMLMALEQLKPHQVLANVPLGVCKASLSLQIKLTDPIWWWFPSLARSGVLWGFKECTGMHLGIPAAPPSPVLLLPSLVFWVKVAINAVRNYRRWCQLPSYRSNSRVWKYHSPWVQHKCNSRGPQKIWAEIQWCPHPLLHVMAGRGGSLIKSVLLQWIGTLKCLTAAWTLEVPFRPAKSFFKLLFTLTFNQELKPSYLSVFQFVIIAYNNQDMRQVNNTFNADCVLLKRANYLRVQTLVNCLIWSQVCESILYFRSM